MVEAEVVVWEELVEAGEEVMTDRFSFERVLLKSGRALEKRSMTDFALD